MASTCCGGKSWARKLLFVGAIVLLGVFVVKKTGLGPYIRHSVGEMFASVDQNIPTKAKIAAFEQEIKDFENNVIEPKFGPLGELKRDVVHLENRLQTKEAELAKYDVPANILGKQLADKNLSQIILNDETLTRSVADSRLDALLDKCEPLNREVVHLRKQLSTNQEILQAKRKELDFLRGKLAEFQEDLAQMKLRESQLDFNEMKNDSSSYSEIITKIKKRGESIKKYQDARHWENFYRNQPAEKESAKAENTVTVTEENETIARFQRYKSSNSKTQTVSTE